MSLPSAIRCCLPVDSPFYTEVRMIKKMVSHGNSAALIIDKPILLLSSAVAVPYGRPDTEDFALYF